MFKKMMLLASMALAAVAFAVPASASAATWTDNGAHLGAGQHATGSFSGFLKFTTPSPPLPVHSTFGCTVDVKITAIGPNGGKVTEFNPTTSTCLGTGIFNGCTLTEDFSNITHVEEEVVVNTWDIALSTESVNSTVTSTGGNLTIRNVYAAGCAVPGSHLEFGAIAITPTLSEGTKGSITSLAISGTATNGVTKAEGSVAQAGTTLGIT